jgi:amino acid permease
MRAKTGIEFPQDKATGIDREHIKVQLEHQTENNKMTLEYKEKWFEKLFSPNFFVFIVTILVLVSGFVYMCVDGVVKGDIIDYWKLILPVVTTYIGYAIGRAKQVDG